VSRVLALVIGIVLGGLWHERNETERLSRLGCEVNLEAYIVEYVVMVCRRPTDAPGWLEVVE